MAGKQPEVIEAVLRSSSLYRGEIRVSETRTPGSLNLRSGRKVKDLLQPVLFWFLNNAPAGLALAPFQLVAGLARMLYWIPRNPLRQTCTDVCRIAARQGFTHEPGMIYRQFLQNFVSAGRGYHLLLRGGPTAVKGRIEFGADCRRIAKDTLQAYGGVIVACPHNFGSAFAALEMNRSIPVIGIMKNSATIRRTRLALEAFERMQVRILMVRSGNPFELSRAMFAALKEGNVVAATVDNVVRGEGAVPARIFGQDVSFAPWAAKIAAKKQAPLVPSFYHSRGDRIVAAWGEPLVTDDLQQAMQHYVSYFESKILEDPASWVYLADRKWRRVLRSAAESQSSSTT